MPAETTPPPSAPSTAEDGLETKARVATILVVEDDRDTREAMVELLAERGYAVIAFEDGRKAFDYLARERAPACVVLDLWMPEMDGWSLASELLQGRLPRVPILVVTAASSHFGYPSVAPRYVLRKPVSPERLLTLVKELVQRSEPRPQ
jgi:CheY-like chemotaxis protein